MFCQSLIFCEKNMKLKLAKLIYPALELPLRCAKDNIVEYRSKYRYSTRMKKWANNTICDKFFNIMFGNSIQAYKQHMIRKFKAIKKV